MRVKWTVFDKYAYQMDYNSTDESMRHLIDRNRYYDEYEGEVVTTYKPFFGQPRFIVALDSGEIREVRMTDCTVLNSIYIPAPYAH